MVAGIVAAFIAALCVFLWFVAEAQATGLVPTLLGEWTVGYAVTFILNLIMWELAFVASWFVPASLIIYFLWYEKLPSEERKEYKRGQA